MRFQPTIVKFGGRVEKNAAGRPSRALGGAGGPSLFFQCAKSNTSSGIQEILLLTTHGGVIRSRLYIDDFRIIDIFFPSYFVGARCVSESKAYLLNEVIAMKFRDMCCFFSQSLVILKLKNGSSLSFYNAAEADVLYAKRFKKCIIYV